MAIAASASVAAPGGEEAVYPNADMISDAAEARRMLRALTVAEARAVLLIWRPAMSLPFSNAAQTLSMRIPVHQANGKSHEHPQAIDDPLLFDLADSIGDLSFLLWKQLLCRRQLRRHRKYRQHRRHRQHRRRRPHHENHKRYQRQQHRHGQRREHRKYCRHRKHRKHSKHREHRKNCRLRDLNLKS